MPHGTLTGNPDALLVIIPAVCLFAYLFNARCTGRHGNRRPLSGRAIILLLLGFTLGMALVLSRLFPL